MWLAGLTPHPQFLVSAQAFSLTLTRLTLTLGVSALTLTPILTPEPSAAPSGRVARKAPSPPPLQLRRFLRHPCAQQRLCYSWLQTNCLVFNDASSVSFNTTAFFPIYGAVSHRPAFWQEGPSEHHPAPLAQGGSLGGQAQRVAPWHLCPLVSCCVCTVAFASFPGLLPGATASQGPLGSPRTATCGLGLWVGRDPAPRRRGHGCVGWCADGAPSAGSGFGRCSVPSDRSPWGLPAQEAFISFLPHPWKDTGASPVQLGLPRTSQDLLFTAGPLGAPSASPLICGLCSELLSVLAGAAAMSRYWAGCALLCWSACSFH